MSAPTNHWKLGAFVLGSFLVALAATVVLTAQTLQIQTVRYTSYFDEQVTGLEVGSPVSFRGVKIGNVSAIEVAPDRRHVEITYSLGVAVLRRLGLAGKGTGLKTRITVPPELRVQIASTGLTGTKFLQIDFFDTGGAPPPVLPFPVPANTIPARPSTMKSLEDAAMRAFEEIPEMTRDLRGAVAKVNLFLDDLNRRGLPARAVSTLDGTDELVARLQGSLAKLDRALDRLEGKGGLLASVQRTSDALGDMAGPGLVANMDETGRDVREAAVALRQLVEALERDPDMLLKGKAKVHR